jgi:hypothetical protein
MTTQCIMTNDIAPAHSGSSPMCFREKKALDFHCSLHFLQNVIVSFSGVTDFSQKFLSIQLITKSN